jgi:hypothetical protein
LNQFLCLMQWDKASSQQAGDSWQKEVGSQRSAKIEVGGALRFRLEAKNFSL